MKTIYLIPILLLALICSSCEYDNYDAPSLLLKGQLKYKEDTFQFDGNVERGLLKIFQSGFGKVDVGTLIRVNQDGSFQQLLFGGEYWLTPNNSQYPFEFKDFKSLGVGLGYDSIHIQLSGDLEKNLEVIPYYTLENFSTLVNGDHVVLKFSVVKTGETAKQAPKVIKARAYLGTSAIVNSRTACIAETQVEIDNIGSVEISVPIASYRNAYVNNFRDYAFCRVAIELENIPNYYLFSQVVKQEDIPNK